MGGVVYKEIELRKRRWGGGTCQFAINQGVRLRPYLHSRRGVHTFKLDGSHVGPPLRFVPPVY